MALLEAEEKDLEMEKENLADETESIKRHNMALFDAITSNQEKQLLTKVDTENFSQTPMNQSTSLMQGDSIHN